MGSPKFRHILFLTFVLAVVAASSSLSFRTTEEMGSEKLRPDETSGGALTIGGIPWGAEIHRESEHLRSLGLTPSKDRLGGGVSWTSSTLSVGISVDGRIETIRGETLLIGDKIILKRGQPKGQVPKEVSSSFHQFAKDDWHWYGIASSKEGRQYLLYCEVRNERYVGFNAQPIPISGSPGWDNYPYSLFTPTSPNGAPSGNTKGHLRESLPRQKLGQ